jgi:hypothetical protein
VHKNNIIKAWAYVSTAASGSSPTVNNGFNVSSVTKSEAGNTITVNFAADMADATYAVHASLVSAAAFRIHVTSQAGGSFVLTIVNADGTAAAANSINSKFVHISVIGLQ